jgi:hypothetical protein
MNTMISVDGNVFWMGKRNFFSAMMASSRSCPAPCNITSLIGFKPNYIDKVVVGHNKKFKEITWFYVSDNNTAGTINPEKR